MTKWLLIAAAAAVVCQAQIPEQPPTIEISHVPSIVRPYMPRKTPPIRLQNSSRLHSLIRAGNLYLTVADALALAIENNLNLEIDRYGPLLADSALERSKAGGPLRGVLPGISQIASVNSGVGVNGTIAAAGLSGGGSGGSGVGGNGGATVQQVGAVVPNFDAALQNVTSFGHITTPETYTNLAQTDSLVQYNHTYNTQLTQGFITGGTASYREYQQTFGENAAGDVINPSSSVRMDLIVNQPLLQRFGVRLNNRTIRVSQINTTAAREVFRGQLLDLCASVLNLYYTLGAAGDELRARQHALEIAQKFYDDTKKEVAAEALPSVQLPPAAAEVSTRQQELDIARANVRQQEVRLKEAISHTEDPELEPAGVVLVDRMQIPDADDLPPLRQMVTTAMAKRPDVAVSKYRDQTDEINLAGTANPLLPILNVQYQTYNRGTGGVGHVVNGEEPNPVFVGGYGRAFRQTFQNDFPNNSGTLGFQAAIGNRIAQADYGVDQLTHRQSEVSSQRDLNAIVVEVAARVAALRQAHARYDTARDTRKLEEQLLAEDQRAFMTGSKNATFQTLMSDQRALVTAQISEVNAAATYAQARVSLDQTLGETLEKNDITLDEGLNGHVDRQSQIPDVLDNGKK
ncbi:MAG TPA: TolC family protein [Bryobacteraceae bacterium]|jgi:outer membrane protein TolC|nr:TolC family protein [Bryobacteraceae bacterium]